MSRYELLSPEGLRIDGRRWNELRRFSAQMSTQSTADGSSYVETGNTKVICTVTGPAEPANRTRTLLDRAWVGVEVVFAPFSGFERKKRGRGDKRVQEMQTALQRTFSQSPLTHLHPRSEISISLHILSQDGSVLATCINAATLALVDAGIPMTDYVAAVTAGCSLKPEGNAESEPLLDLNSLEEADLPVVTVATIGGGEKIALLQMENRVHLDRLEGMVAVAVDGCGKVGEMIDGVVRERGEELARTGAL
ncbi:Exosome non-catalytic core component [Rhizina undulata]